MAEKVTIGNCELWHGENTSTRLLDELFDAGFQFNGPECDKVDEIGRRIEGEQGVLLDLLGECYNVISTIDPEDGDEAKQLHNVLEAIDRAELAANRKKEIKWTTK